MNKCNKYTTTEKSHNQSEIREYYFANDINWIIDKSKWSGIKSIGYMKKFCDKKLVEERYFISDIEAKYVELLSRVIRSE